VLVCQVYDHTLPENKDRSGLSVKYGLRLNWIDKPHEPQLNSSKFLGVDSQDQI
jgi:hypothetical protein